MKTTKSVEENYFTSCDDLTFSRCTNHFLPALQDRPHKQAEFQLARQPHNSSKC